MLFKTHTTFWFDLLHDALAKTNVNEQNRTVTIHSLHYVPQPAIRDWQRESEMKAGLAEEFGNVFSLMVLAVSLYPRLPCVPTICGPSFHCLFKSPNANLSGKQMMNTERTDGCQKQRVERRRYDEAPGIVEAPTLLLEETVSLSSFTAKLVFYKHVRITPRCHL